MSNSWISEYLVISSLTGMEHTGHIHKKHEEQTNTRRPGYSIQPVTGIEQTSSVFGKDNLSGSVIDLQKTEHLFLQNGIGKVIH
jgi:hypothetical protein